jgi:Cu2+-exporting ATPase
MHASGLTIRQVDSGRILVRSPEWFRPHGPIKAFLRRTFAVDGVSSVTLNLDKFEAEIAFAPGRLQELASAYVGRRRNQPELAPGLLDQDPPRGTILRIFRYGRLVSDWTRQQEQPGLLRLRHPQLRGHPGAWDSISRQLDELLGVRAFRIDGIGGGVSVRFDPSLIHPQQIVRALHLAVASAAGGLQPLLHRIDLPVATASLALSATATFFSPALLPASAALMVATAVPSYRRAMDVVMREHRLGVDVLDSIIFTTCLFTGAIFVGGVTAFFLSVGRTLLRRTRAQTERLLVDVYGRQPSIVRLERPDGTIEEVSIDLVTAGDIILVHTGDAVPVDGIVQSGEGMLDQQALTGEATPVERGAGDPVLAATLLVAGQLRVKVERAGKDTTAGRIANILRATVAHKLELQSQGEALADTVVIPALGVAVLAGGMLGPSAALAVINSDLGTGIRMAAPLAVISSLTACIRGGMLVKQGRALELLPQVDCVVFDKTGTLTRSVPEVGGLVSCGKVAPAVLLRLAAAAEQKFTHPIARAILNHYRDAGGEPLPVLDESQYTLGFGLTVTIEDKRIRLGSRRFMDREGVSFPAKLDGDLSLRRDAGHTLIYMAIDDEPAGVIDLRPSSRPEAADVIDGLRGRGIEDIAILSGDHEIPTRELARQLGVDRHFSEVLPQDKAAVIARLQAEGRTVCFVGDGINDALALRRADVSISLHGAAGIATDTAQVVFLEGNLARMNELFDIASDLQQNVGQSWTLIRGANGICIAGVFLGGFNIWHSVFFNNVSALGALGNSLRPLRRASGMAGMRELLA